MVFSPNVAHETATKVTPMTSQEARRSSRRSRGKSVAAPPPPVLPGMVGGHYRPMSDAEMIRIHELVLQLLADLGLSQVTPSLEARAVAAGCHVDPDGRLRFPRALVEDVIANTRRKFVLHGIDPTHDIEVGGRRVHAGTGGAAPTIMDFETGKYRESTVADLYDVARLVDKLDNIHWYHRSVVARDAQNTLDLDINTTYACLSGTSKSIAVSYTDADSVRAVMPMLDAVAGGEGNFRTRPFCTAVCCHVVPPMRFATESCDALEAAVEAGMPILLVAAGQAGATAPAALAGAVAQACAEVLAGLVLCNIIDPNCRAIFAAWPFVSDLRTGAMSGGSGEQALLSAACAQMAGFYDLPNSVPAGMTDSKLPDKQAGGEKGYTVALAAHAGASMIHECAGMQGSLMGTNFEAYVMDNDLLGAILRTVRGVEVTEDALSFDVIRDVVMGEGHYLGHPQTFNRMKSDYVYPEIACRLSISEWEEAGAPDARDVARDKVRRILADHYPSHIAPETDRVLRDNYNIILPATRMRRGNGTW
ncbi:trimethylamine methyltransferase family protein [Alisedimentitalea sp. MJ-SS2]|uniref:trimethylamine methyltransferase family protein n=1 Tax=Aliisedimentitalea sp. MJ-SS2 TaxID=3049795 RepID=UPI00291165B4|nr:trimethylamine methyltransferase family protein [Alisedimentitalea sp. MJ-SS2]MDU8927199.1 trimethylamine methyltransferase family protein [Alisedimentitalea sp. MJ-SS2]